jgi:methyltransferase (TIGR00027 family)
MSVALPAPNLEVVSETLFLPLFALAIGSKDADPILRDEHAVELADRVIDLCRGSPNTLFARLAAGRLPRALIVSLSLRMRRYDAYVRSFLDAVPDGVVVNMGCGLDVRRHRVDNGRMRWFDLDLPPVIGLRRSLLEETDRMRFVAGSVTETAWLGELPVEDGDRFLFLAEGLFMYLPETDVRALVSRLRNARPGSELVAEVSAKWIVKLMHSRLGRGKFRRQFGCSQDAVFASGVERSADLESYAPGVQVLDDWTYFDDGDPRMGWMRYFARWDYFRRVQWTVHARLG